MISFSFIAANIDVGNNWLFTILTFQFSNLSKKKTPLVKMTSHIAITIVLIYDVSWKYIRMKSLETRLLTWRSSQDPIPWQ